MAVDEVEDALNNTYFVVGTFAFMLNVLLMAALYKQKGLHFNKCFWMAGLQAFYNALDMLAYSIYGIDRMLGSGKEAISVLQCALKVYNIIWAQSLVGVSLMSLTMTLDRIFAFTKPLFYMTMNCARYMRWAFGVGFLLCATISFIPSWYYPLVVVSDNDNATNGICISALAHGPEVDRLQFSMASKLSILSVALYPYVIYLRHKQSITVAPVGLSLENLNYRKACIRNMAISMGVSALITLVTRCLVIEIGLREVQPDGKAWDPRSGVLWLATLINPLMMPMLYYGRHLEVRKSLSALFLCKQLPDDVKMWFSPTASTATTNNNNNTASNKNNNSEFRAGSARNI